MEGLENSASLNEYLIYIINLFGSTSYLILFLLVFLVTGVALTPFLPGNSLLFLSGTLAGSGYLNIWILYLTLLAAAILGNTLNYWLGYKFGSKLFENKTTSKLFKKEYLTRAESFYEKHGGKAIIFARFLVILRTFTPFVAGIVKMPYSTFVLYNILGGFIWITSITFGGFLFGGIPLIRDNFEVVAVVIFLALYSSIIIKQLRNKKSSDK